MCSNHKRPFYFFLHSEALCAEDFSYSKNTIINLSPSCREMEFSLTTSRSCDYVVRMSVLTDFKAVVSFMVSPPISTVMPCILDAAPHLPSPRKKGAGQGSVKKCKR